jgi:DNA-binding NtrC family response regulator
MNSRTILIVDEDKGELKALELIMRKEFEKVLTTTDPNRIPSLLGQGEIDVIMLDMNFRAEVHNGNEGLYWMREIFRHDSNISVVIVTASADVDLAVKAIKEGAVDYILKPWDKSRLLATVNTALRLRASRLEASNLKKDNRQLKDVINSGGEKIVRGASPTMINVMNIVKKVAATDANVLITGENGTGKELVAREIHNLSKRAGELMVSVDIGSLTETLFEGELFGHVKGAFTDAREDRKGKFEAAQNGTMFLDEIGNLSLRSQAKLLNVLQNRYIVRVGSNKQIPVNIRLICATNCDLSQMVSEGRFREDLLYRINTIMIEVPPLRDRVDDIPILANHFLRVNIGRYGKGRMKISTPALEKLANHEWPGNVRELQHTIEKAVIMSDSDVLKPSDFVFSSAPVRQLHSEMTLAEMEKRAIAESLRKYGNITTVAGKLGITRQTLYNKMKSYGLGLALILISHFLTFCNKEGSYDREKSSDAYLVRSAIHNSIGWAKNKDFELLYRTIANDSNYLEVDPGPGVIRGFSQFRENEVFWGNNDFRAVRYDIRDLTVNFSEGGDVAWFYCILDDINEWKGQPASWMNTRWTGVLEKRKGQWVMVQMHFSFAEQ